MPGPDGTAAAEDPFAEFKNTARENWDELKDRWEEVSKAAESYIRENPVKSVLIALGAGVLVGMILKD